MNLCQRSNNDIIPSRIVRIYTTIRELLLRIPNLNINREILTKNRIASYTRTKLILAREYFSKNIVALYLIIGLVVLSAIIYAYQHLLFLSYENREILGISLQFVSAFILITDQILKLLLKDETLKKEGIYKKVAEWVNKIVSKGRIKISLFVLLIVFPIALIAILIFQAISTGELLSWGVIGGVFFFVLIAFNSYLYILTYTNKLLDKLGNRYQRFKDTSKNMLYSNVVLFISSFILAYVAVYVSRLIGTFPGQLDLSQPVISIVWYFVRLLFLAIWLFFNAFIVAPVYVLSFSYFIVLGLLGLFLVFRLPKLRFVFWILIFTFWTSGSILLLTNAIYA